MGQITPYLIYQDAAAAIEWLTRVFGFREKLRYAEPDGRVSHAELQGPDDGLVMIGSTGSGAGEPTGAPNAFLVVDVTDVDAHHSRSTAEGARVLKDLADQPYGIRSYSVADLEGFRWDFVQHIKDVTPEDWGAVSAT